jgi:hypothetical protein
MRMILGGIEARFWALKLWQDCVIATPPVDGRIVFCFAFVSHRT